MRSSLNLLSLILKPFIPVLSSLGLGYIMRSLERLLQMAALYLVLDKLSDVINICSFLVLKGFPINRNSLQDCFSHFPDHVWHSICSWNFLSFAVVICGILIVYCREEKAVFMDHLLGEDTSFCTVKGFGVFFVCFF